jgi:membrane protease YdiL (CAAX protease family)
MVACFEELLFRAVLFRIVRQRWGTRTALVVSFLAFALAHMQNEHVSVLAILITGVAGLTLSACYRKRAASGCPSACTSAGTSV